MNLKIRMTRAPSTAIVKRIIGDPELIRRDATIGQANDALIRAPSRTLPTTSTRVVTTSQAIIGTVIGNIDAIVTGMVIGTETIAVAAMQTDPRAGAMTVIVIAMTRVGPKVTIVLTARDPPMESHLSTSALAVAQTRSSGSLSSRALSRRLLKRP